MKTIGIFYGSTTGRTQEISEAVSDKLGNCELIDVAKASKEDIAKFDNLILAASTYGDGELQTDWEDFAAKLSDDDFAGKVVAKSGLETKIPMPIHFVIPSFYWQNWQKRLQSSAKPKMKIMISPPQGDWWAMSFWAWQSMKTIKAI